MWRMSSLRGANIPRSRKLSSSMPKMSTCPSLASYSAPRKTSILPEYLPASCAALFVAEYELCSVKAMPSRPAPIAASMASSGEDELSCVKAWLWRSIFMLIDKPEELSFQSRCIAVSERAEPRSFRALRELFRGEGGVPEPEREVGYGVELEPLVGNAVARVQGIPGEEIGLLHRVHLELHASHREVPGDVLARREELVEVMVEAVCLPVALFRQDPFEREHPAVRTDRLEALEDAFHAIEDQRLLPPVLSEPEGDVAEHHAEELLKGHPAGGWEAALYDRGVPGHLVEEELVHLPFGDGPAVGEPRDDKAVREALNGLHEPGLRERGCPFHLRRAVPAEPGELQHVRLFPRWIAGEILSPLMARMSGRVVVLAPEEPPPHAGGYVLERRVQTGGPLKPAGVEPYLLEVRDVPRVRAPPPPRLPRYEIPAVRVPAREIDDVLIRHAEPGECLRDRRK